MGWRSRIGSDKVDLRLWDVQSEGRRLKCGTNWTSRSVLFRAPHRRWPWRVSARREGRRSVAAILAIAVGLVMLPRRDFPVRGEPFAVAKVEVLPAPRRLDGPGRNGKRAPNRSAADRPRRRKWKRRAGSRSHVGRGGPPKPLIIDVAQALGVKLAPTPDTRLHEKSKYGFSPSAQSDGSLSP